MTPRFAPALALAAAVVALASGAACNAIVGNGDIQFVTEAGPRDATAGEEPPAQPEAAVAEASVDEREAEAPEAGEPSEASLAVDAGCEAGAKACAGSCVAFDDPGYGCGPIHCSPCELLNAVAGCGTPDGGVDGGALSCDVAICKTGHADCNGTPLDGCETDISADLYNCGTCGHDCTRLPNVAGNVSCMAGICAFDDSACARGYGICSTNPDDGCDTSFSDSSHCGGCSTSCNASFPDCSTTGNVANPFACTSGCATGLSPCGASCVDEQTDPNHCGGCAAQCPAVAGGTATCLGGGSCGFTCNANDHLCGTGNGASCAANNDPSNCGVGAACGKCTAPANANPTCTGGTTCGYACIPGAHACGSACVLNDDPNNCGSLCGTNCPGPTEGSGVASCDGNVCAIACGAGQSLCGSACVNEQTDVGNCGSCAHVCGSGQACGGGQCVCNAASCSKGCCDASGTCQTAALFAPCSGAGGGSACASGCPAAIPEAQSLVLWLVGDTYVPGAAVWTDQSGHANAACSSCPSAFTGALNGHATVSFDGSSFFALGDPGGIYESAAFTVLLVATPDPGAASNAQLLALSDGSGNTLSLQRSSGDPDLLLQLLAGANDGSLVATGGWSGSAELVAAEVSGAGALLTAGSSAVTGNLGTPANVDYDSSYLGTDPASQTLNYTGQVAEVLVFDTALSSTSIASIESYLSARYALP